MAITNYVRGASVFKGPLENGTGVSIGGLAQASVILTHEQILALNDTDHAIEIVPALGEGVIAYPHGALIITDTQAAAYLRTEGTWFDAFGFRGRRRLGSGELSDSYFWLFWGVASDMSASDLGYMLGDGGYEGAVYLHSLEPWTQPGDSWPHWPIFDYEDPFAIPSEPSWRSVSNSPILVAMGGNHLDGGAPGNRMKVILLYSAIDLNW